MNKISLLRIAAIALLVTFSGTSCKKPVNPVNPTNNNTRLLSYTKTTSITNNTLLTPLPSTVTENYRFYYDNLNRVIQITYTSNDSFSIFKNSVFRYSNDSVFKTTTNVTTNAVVERDTFVYNSLGQLTTAFTPHLITTYDYYGKLLANYTLTAHNDTDASVSASYSYTSDDGDFLKHNFDGNLKAAMQTVGRTLNFQTYWTYFYPQPNGTIFLAPAALISKPIVTSYSDAISNYNDAPIMFTSVDTLNIMDTVYYPGEVWRGEDYRFYTEMPNRTGDYLQIQSFSMYGYNVYQNAHLIQSMSSPNRTANVYYQTDAFSKITQTRVVTLDSTLNNYTAIYNYSYETF